MIPEFLVGYKLGHDRSVLLEGCRSEGTEFLSGRAHDASGKDVYAILAAIKKREDELYAPKFGLGLAGFLVYQTFHPIRSFKDNNDITAIILSEVRPT